MARKVLLASARETNMKIFRAMFKPHTIGKKKEHLKRGGSARRGRRVSARRGSGRIKMDDFGKCVCKMGDDVKAAAS